MIMPPVKKIRHKIKPVVGVYADRLSNCGRYRSQPVYQRWIGVLDIGTIEVGACEQATANIKAPGLVPPNLPNEQADSGQANDYAGGDGKKKPRSAIGHCWISGLRLA